MAEMWRLIVGKCKSDGFEDLDSGSSERRPVAKERAMADRQLCAHAQIMHYVCYAELPMARASPIWQVDIQ